MIHTISRHKSLLSLLIIGWSFSVQAQHPLDTLLKKFDSYRVYNLQEKIFIHTNHDFFLTGETLWFKIYCTEGALHYPLNQSSVGYVELLDKDNTPVIQTKVSLENGEGNGACFLPASMVSGNYKLRAYTRWMRNFNPEFYFEKNITIVNTFRKIEREKSPVDLTDVIDFFPEGGYLVNGVTSKVAFKITDDTGKGKNLSGAILNSRKDTVARIVPLKFGMGTFHLTPSINEQYTAILEDPAGTKIISHLPEIKENGYVLSLEEKDAQTISVSVKTNHPVISNSQLILLVHARQVISKAEVKNIHSEETVFYVNRDELSDGISHFTVFTDGLVPVCQRLYFKKPLNKLSVSLSADQSQYQKRKKVTIALKAACADKPTDANLSLSVQRIDSLASEQQPGILEYLYLSSDLSGTIESSQYYFSNDSLARDAADNLMLTHGWRRFKWNDILNTIPVINFTPEVKGQIITARLTNNLNRSNGRVVTYLSAPGKNATLYGTISNENGGVKFEISNLYGPHRLIVQTDLTKDSVYTITPDNPFSTERSAASFQRFTLSAAVRNDLVQRSVAMQVQDIFTETLAQNNIAASDTLPFFGQGDNTYYLDDYTRFPVMEEVMREYVPGVLVRKRKDGFYFIVLDNVRKTVFREDPLILLDGVPVFDTDEIMTFDPRKVKRLDVINRRYYLGPLMFHGIVSYVTYNGDLGGFELDPRAISLNYEGLQQHQEFYQPQYESQQQKNSRTPDKRYTLHWDPNVKTASDGTKQIEFYTSDVPGNYEIVVEGITKKGCPGGSTQLISVK